MSSSQALGGNSRPGRVLGPYLDKIIKNVAWRKHAQLVSSCKSVLDSLEILTDSSNPISNSAIPLFAPADADFVLQPLILAIDSGSTKVIEPALECIYKLVSQGLIRSEIDRSKHDVLLRVIDSVCRCGGLGDDSVELAVLRALLSMVRSPALVIRGDSLVQIVKSCYNLYLGTLSGTSQICAKAVLAQIVTIVYARVEADSMDVQIRPVAVGELLELSDKSLNDGNLVQVVQNFVGEVVEGSEGVPIVPSLVESQNGDVENCRGDGGLDSIEGSELEDRSKIRQDGFFLFKNLCKFSLKFSNQENPEDHLLLRGQVLSLELLKVVTENAGPIWRTNEKFLGAIKQYLCLSLLKNSALSAMSIFQLSCSIFMGLLSRFREGLKAEIGLLYPMLILRVLENVLQPSFLQKMTVLSLLEKICEDSQLIVDIFVNYDSDVDAPNIFERTVNGLLKTALGVPPGSATTLSPTQDLTFRYESVKCLVTIIKSMGSWMDLQLRTGYFYPSKNSEIDISAENHTTLNGDEGTAIDYDLHSEANSEPSEATTLEQRRAYKIELQKGISLFNRKPSKGIEFLINAKKIGSSPEEIALFLKNTSGLSEAMIGDYVGEAEEFSLKVMHAYVDSMNFEHMDFGEAIRFFLQGFRLPGEAQKIDRIMEKFAERYCKCNPDSFTSADTAYVLAYSVILLNTDAHNNMVKDKMSKADFIRNNRGIDDGKDLPEEYLGSLYDHIVKNEIKMNATSAAPLSKQATSINKLLGLDSILNLVTGKQAEEKALGANDVLIRHIQEQFKANKGKSESVFYAVTDAAIVRLMTEVCWAPMLAAFSMTLDRTDDKAATSQCLQGFRHAVHVTSVMCMQTQRDAFVTTMAKFTYLHCAADMKQKNVDAVKVIISIAIENGNYLQEAWEHILTCLSRFEHLHLLGEGAPPDASFFAISSSETEEKLQKSPAFASRRKKGNALQNPAVRAVVRGGSYDSTTHGINASGLLTLEQINNFISNLYLLDQIGPSELNHIFVHSQSLNSEAIVAFVKALCKVSMAELQSPTDPQVFSLTKIVEIAHYNMRRIRLVWTRIWNVLSDFFVSVGCSENLSVAIFVMDSLRQLAMKFLEREELANYNFQNEFLRPFVIVMQKSNSAEIRELIVRCISQMVLIRVNNVKSGWKSVFTVFTVAAADERKNIVLLAFETMEKIVRDYFPYITETETTTFTDCVRCLITFTNSRFKSDVSLDPKKNSDVSLKAIAFLRFCAVKLAEGGLVRYGKVIEDDSHVLVNEHALDGHTFTDKDDQVYFWVPLLTGLSRLTSDPRQDIRKSALEVLFNILKDHGNLFSLTFWNSVFNSVVFPVFKNLQKMVASEDLGNKEIVSICDTYAVAARCHVDLFVNFFDIVRSLLPNIASLLTSSIRSPNQSFASTGISAFVCLAANLGIRLSEKEWTEIFLSLKVEAASVLPEFWKVVHIMDNIEVPDEFQVYSDAEQYSDHGYPNDQDDDSLGASSYVVVRTKSHIAVQLLVTQVIPELYNTHRDYLSATNITILLEMLYSIASHAHELNSEAIIRQKLQKVCSILETSDPPMVHFENESHQNFLKFAQTLLIDNPSLSEKIGVENQLVAVCETILRIYLDCAGHLSAQQLPVNQPPVRWILPLGLAKKEELTARTSLVVLTLQVLSSLENLGKYLSYFFPLLVNLIRCEHGSGEVQHALSEIFQSSIGSILMNL